MWVQKKRSVRSKSSKRMVGLVLSALFLLAAIVTGVCGIWIGTLAPASVVGAIFLFVVGVGTLAISFIEKLFLVQPPVVEPPAPQPIAPQTPAAQTITTKPVAVWPIAPPIFFFNLPLGDLNELYGHKLARATLITRTSNGGSSSIVGERRAGKTWLLEYLRLVAPMHSKLGLAYRIGRVSAIHAECKNLKGFVLRALKELKVSQQSHSVNLQPLSQLSRAVRDLTQQGFRPVLCIDEFEGFNNRQEFNVDFVEGLRAMAQDDGLVLVTASKRPLKELIEDLIGQTSPLFNIVQQISLSPFTEEEAREFVHDKSNMAGFTKQESDFFFDQSTLHNTNGEPCWPPLRLQLVGQMLLDDKQTVHGQPLDDELRDFRYRSEFEARLRQNYQAVVR